MPIGREKMSFLGERNEEGQGILYRGEGGAGREGASQIPEKKIGRKLPGAWPWQRKKERGEEEEGELWA